MAIIDISGVPHAYDLTAPTDEPCALVFIHGWLLSRSYWQPLIERLASIYQCLAYDLRGFGSSQLCCHAQQNGHQAAMSSLQPDWRNTEAGNFDVSCYRPVAYAKDLAILLETLNLSNVWLIGHSLGGTIALWSAAQLPEQVKGVICLNSGGGIYVKEEFERFRTAGQQLLKLRPRWLPYLPLLDLLFTRTAVGRPIERCWGRQRLVDFVNAHLEAALGTLLDSTTESEVHLLPQIVSKIQQPVYFLAGTQDAIMEPKYVRHLASFHSMFQLDGENVIELPNCGHLAMVEQPDLVAEYIHTLIKRH
jgi:2-succinyl-6-hydroxy-2,4-cyclohexadiene-1-carboxylate synthase